MKIEILSRYHSDYLDTRKVFDTAHGEAREVIASVAARIRAEQARDAALLVDLRAKADDPARSESVRRLAQLEIERLGATTYGPNEAETEAFNEQIDIAQAAIADASTIRERCRQLFSDAADELAKMRKDVLGDERAILDPRGIDGCRNDFEQLGGTNT